MQIDLSEKLPHQENNWEVKILEIANPERQLMSVWSSGETVALIGPAGPWPRSVGRQDFADHPVPHAHLWLASSGTSGSVKLVALSRGALEAGAARVNALLGAEPRDVWINALPCHHVAGLAIHVRATLAGSKVVYFPSWNPGDFVRQATRSAATLSSLVPTQLHDLVASGVRCPASLRAVIVGGGALHERLHARALDLGWPVLRSYGMTEACSQVATERSPGSALDGWLPLLDQWEAKTDRHGILELRGPSLLTGWMIFDRDGTARWEDPKREGWFRTGDRAELRGREVRVLGRVDDLVKIRGELVDVGSLERSLQEHVRAGKIALHVQPDERNGAALHVVAENAAAVREAEAALGGIFPPYARPSEVVCGTIETTALGKTVRRVAPR